MADITAPNIEADLSPEELFAGDASEILSVRGKGQFHCLVHKQGLGLVYYAYPEGFPGDFVLWSLALQHMPAWTGTITPTVIEGACQWTLARALRERRHTAEDEEGDCRTTHHQS